MDKDEYIEEVHQALLKALPAAIKAMQEIVNDENAPANTRIKASNSLSRAQRSLKQIKKDIAE